MLTSDLTAHLHQKRTLFLLPDRKLRHRECLRRHRFKPRPVFIQSSYPLVLGPTSDMGDGGAQDQEISIHSSERQGPWEHTGSRPACLQVVSKGFPEGGDGQVRARVSEHPQAHQLGKVGASRSLSASCQKLSGSEPNVMEAMIPECFLACMILSGPRASPKTRSCSQQSRPGAYRSASSSS